MFYTGDTINSMTLGGLALAIGILVDQSIVVLDNIVRHLRMGKPKAQAALDGTREVSLPVLVSTMTFVIVFFPVVFLTGIPRFLFQPLAVTVTLAVVASYLIAMLVIPSFSVKLLRAAPVTGGGNPGHSSGLESPAWFDTLFSRMIKLRALVILVSVALLVLAGLAAMTMGTELFPSVDSNQFAIYVRLPSGTRIENTERVIARVEESIMGYLGEPIRILRTRSFRNRTCAS